MEEILNLAYREIIKSGFEDILAAGVVLTGGTAIMSGTTELAEHIFNMPVRRGCPAGVGGLSDVVNSPMYATGVGLVVYGSKNISKDAIRKSEGNIFTNIIKDIKKWFIEFF